MKLALTNLEHFDALSQETPAFTADLIVDGTPRGKVRNHGSGGANFYTDPKVEREIDAYAKTLPMVEFDGMKFHETAETLIFQLIP
jgi:hypothetical protein